MMAAPSIKKKVKGNHQPGDPFPVPISSFTGFSSSASSWNYYDGVFKKRLVIIDDLNQVASLWHNGYFGKLKNTHLHPNSSDNNERQSKFKKQWKLLEKEGLKDFPNFKDIIELQDDSYKEKDPTHEAVEVDSEIFDDGYVPFEDMKANMKSGRMSSVLENKSSSGNTSNKCIENNANETCSENKAFSDSAFSRENDNDSKRILTFESDQISSIFFEDSNAMNANGHLELLPVEAFFLSFALGCLVVRMDLKLSAWQSQYKGNQSNEPLTIDQMWCEFVNQDPRFPVRYAVYHHYRTKGWVVKCGLKFGADFVLYPVGPEFYHAQYTVMIQCIWSDNGERDKEMSSRDLSWTSLAATERLNTHFKKIPLICYVTRLRSLTSKKFSNISCLKSLSVKEVLLSRWDPVNVSSDSQKEMVILE